ncbi:3-deoxy-7-phosphoheptulonate synthase [Streptomyces sp. NPDC055210]
MRAPTPPARQQPDWPDPRALRGVVADLAGGPPLVRPRECDALRDRLAAAARGEALLLQCGDCAETFAGATPERVTATLRTILQMAVVLTHATSLPVVKVGRIAGQYAKPRSRPTEIRDGVELPSYRGDAVNGAAFDPAARVPDPARLLRAYETSAATLGTIRSLSRSVTADLRRLRAWNRDAYGGDGDGDGDGDPERQDRLEFFTSHEALVLEYERALVRTDARTHAPYGLSGHLLWIGERTRQLDHAHIDLAARIRNPVAVKLGPDVTADEVLALVDRLDPQRRPGRLTLITRFGAARVRDVLPPLVARVAAAGAPVLWVCDPMHGNTVTTRHGIKTRRFGDIVAELAGFLAVHRMLGTHPGGLHLELTGDDVTECLGGVDATCENDLAGRYETACDPRLSRRQALGLAFAAAELWGRARPVRTAPAARRDPALPMSRSR